MEAASADLKPDRIEYETEADREERARQRKADNRRLRTVNTTEDDAGEGWKSCAHMLGWYFTHRNHMASVPAMDPSRDVVQGLKVDRVVRLKKLGNVKKALEALVYALTYEHAVMLYLHFRRKELTGYASVTLKGETLKVPKWSEDSVPVYELYREAPLSKFSQRRAKDEFWKAFRWLEDYAWERGWLEVRAEQRSNKVRVYRREP